MGGLGVWGARSTACETCSPCSGRPRRVDPARAFAHSMGRLQSPPPYRDALSFVCRFLPSRGAGKQHKHLNSCVLEADVAALFAIQFRHMARNTGVAFVSNRHQWAPALRSAKQEPLPTHQPAVAAFQETLQQSSGRAGEARRQGSTGLTSQTWHACPAAPGRSHP
jgi:hypothetical protein